VGVWIPPPVLALATISPVLDHIYQGRDDQGWGDDDETDPRAVGMLIKLDMGERLRGILANIPAPKGLPDWDSLTDWDDEKCVRAGDWMMKGIARVPSLRLNHLGEPEIAHARKIDVDALREEMMRFNQVFMPFPEEPPDWTGFRKRYGGPVRRKVRSWRARCASRYGKANQQGIRIWIPARPCRQCPKARPADG
jgi:hypothetical protein